MTKCPICTEMLLQQSMARGQGPSPTILGSVKALRRNWPPSTRRRKVREPNQLRPDFDHCSACGAAFRLTQFPTKKDSI